MARRKQVNTGTQALRKIISIRDIEVNLWNDVHDAARREGITVSVWVDRAFRAALTGRQ